MLKNKGLEPWVLSSGSGGCRSQRLEDEQKSKIYRPSVATGDSKLRNRAFADVLWRSKVLGLHRERSECFSNHRQRNGASEIVKEQKGKFLKTAGGGPCPLRPWMDKWGCWRWWRRDGYRECQWLSRGLGGGGPPSLLKSDVCSFIILRRLLMIMKDGL